MKMIILYSLILTLQVLLPAESGFNEYFQEGIHKFEDSISKPMVVSLGNFTYGDKKIGSSFSKYLETKLRLSLEKSD
jgi:hypothetical protein